MLLPGFTDQENSEKKINNSAAEYLVLKYLKELAKERGWLVYRSLRIEDHHTKLEGEIDIVIFTTTHGIILLEVKGSKLRTVNGDWSIYNRGSGIWIDIQDPFEQIKDAYFAFRQNHVSLFKLLQVNPMISWGCVFPECDNISGTLSYPSWRFCLSSDFLKFDVFLDVLVKKSIGKLKNSRRRSHRAMDFRTSLNLLQKMAPIENNGKYISADYNHALLQLENETKILRRLMEGFASSPFVFAYGPAGTGKTRAAIYESKRLAQIGKRVLFICKSNLLTNHVAEWLEFESISECVNVISYHDWQMSGSSQTYDALIIDEAQDLVFLDDIRQLILENHGEQRLLRIFGDFDFQNIYHSKKEFEEWMLKVGLAPINYRLTVNCRNTMQIGKRIKKLANFDDSLFSLSSAQGEDIAVIPNIKPEDVPSKVKDCLSDWIKKDYPVSKATVLTYKKAGVQRFQDALFEAINQLDIFRDFPADKEELPSLSDVMTFKGLESPCIILIVEEFDDDWEIILYTAISRAKLKCYLIFTSGIDNKEIQKLLCRI